MFLCLKSSNMGEGGGGNLGCSASYLISLDTKYRFG